MFIWNTLSVCLPWDSHFLGKHSITWLNKTHDNSFIKLLSHSKVKILQLCILVRRHSELMTEINKTHLCYLWFEHSIFSHFGCLVTSAVIVHGNQIREGDIKISRGNKLVPSPFKQVENFRVQQAEQKGNKAALKRGRKRR